MRWCSNLLNLSFIGSSWYSCYALWILLPIYTVWHIFIITESIIFGHIFIMVQTIFIYICMLYVPVYSQYSYLYFKSSLLSIIVARFYWQVVIFLQFWIFKKLFYLAWFYVFKSPELTGLVIADGSILKVDLGCDGFMQLGALHSKNSL